MHSFESQIEKLIPRQFEKIKINCGKEFSGINFFRINNHKPVKIKYIKFSNADFSRKKDVSPHCEAVFFPEKVQAGEWILFLEMKYTGNPGRNPGYLQKALKQLFCTWFYYKAKGIKMENYLTWLIASLPEQRPPFLNFQLTQADLIRWRRRNIIVKLANSINVLNRTTLE